MTRRTRRTPTTFRDERAPASRRNVDTGKVAVNLRAIEAAHEGDYASDEGEVAVEFEQAVLEASPATSPPLLLLRQRVDGAVEGAVDGRAVGGAQFGGEFVALGRR